MALNLPKVTTSGSVVSGMETALANKIGKAVGPKTVPKGWSMGKKTGWNGGLKPPGLARKMTGGQPATTPTEPPRTPGTPRTKKPPEFTS